MPSDAPAFLPQPRGPRCVAPLLAPGAQRQLSAGGSNAAPLPDPRQDWQLARLGVGRQQMGTSGAESAQLFGRSAGTTLQPTRLPSSSKADWRLVLSTHRVFWVIVTALTR